MRKNYWAVKHDMSHSRIYKIWIGMRSRCNNPNSVPYPRYGGKGIKVCEEWNSSANGFENFYLWAMANGYSDDLTIDRVDPHGNYEPNNCRWADKYVQSVNADRKPAKSGYYGISKHSNHDSWYGRVKVYGKVVCTGSAPTAFEAAVMRDEYILAHRLINRMNGVLNGSI